jgi:lipopolysaccharide export system protein LptC
MIACGQVSQNKNKTQSPMAKTAKTLPKENPSHGESGPFSVVPPPLKPANQGAFVVLKPRNLWGLTMIRALLTVSTLSIVALGLYVYTPAFITKTIPLANVSLMGNDNALTGLVIQGLDQQQKPFTLHAKSAHAPTLESDVLLQNVRADLTAGGGDPLSLTSDEGVFNQKKQTLHLKGNVILLKKQDSFRLKDLIIDLKTQQATSLSGVNAALPMGQITAEGLRITDQGKTITFEGKSQFTRNTAPAPSPATTDHP